MREMTGEMLPASSAPDDAARVGNDDPVGPAGVITASPLPLLSIARSHVENGAVKGDAASTSNNHVQVTRIINASLTLSSRSKISAMSSVERERCFSEGILRVLVSCREVDGNIYVCIFPFRDFLVGSEFLADC